MKQLAIFMTTHCVYIYKLLIERRKRTRSKHLVQAPGMQKDLSVIKLHTTDTF